MIKKTWKDKQIERKTELFHYKKSKSFVKFDKLTSRNKIYLIHDNGGRPFKVVANKEGLFVYKKQSDNDDDDESLYNVKILELHDFLGYWYGFDTSHYSLHGNSILVKITNNEYISIGWVIDKFTTDEEIIDYISPVGNSNVPYPVAYGAEYVYFMLDNKKIKRTDMETIVGVYTADNLYSEFYGHIGTKKGNHIKYDFDSIEHIHARIW